MLHRRWVSGLAGLAFLAAGGCLLGACRALVGESAGTSASVREEALRYVALGDSYTIGTGVSAADSWPEQLASRQPGLELMANLGVNGYTSADLIADELPALDELQPEFVTLLIGVNDVVQGVPEATYASNVDRILDVLLSRLAANRVLCVATPDYTVTPQGAAYGDPQQQSAGIARVNTILGAACRDRGIAFVPDIYDLSRAAGDDPAMMADDGLHPSGVQYARWVDAIAPAVDALLAP